MIFKIQKPLIKNNENHYYICNKDKSIETVSLEIGQIPKIDSFFQDKETVVYAKGYIDKKGNLVINRKVTIQEEW